MFPECCCITNRHIGAREGRQLIPHVRFQVPCLGPESPLKSGFACAGLLCSLSESAQMCFFKSSAHIVRAIQEDESSQAIGSVHFFFLWFGRCRSEARFCNWYKQKKRIKQLDWNALVPAEGSQIFSHKWVDKRPVFARLLFVTF